MESIVAVFGPIVVDELMKKVASFIGTQYNLHSHTKDKLESLQGFLRTLKCFIATAEKKQLPGEMVVWLTEFKNWAFQMDDLLDTFAYKKLEHGFSSIRKKTTSLLKFKDNKELSDLDSLMKKMQELNSQMKLFIEIINLVEESKKSSFICELSTGTPKKRKHSFVGRENEKEKIIEFLLNRESQPITKIPLLPILGAGGIGKTALAKVVYNDEEVKKHFSLRMWVRVSNTPDELKLIKEMLGQLANHYGRSTAANLNLDDLKEKLRSEKFLLVLDNVPSGDSMSKVLNIVDEWAPMCDDNEGSRILLTSRQQGEVPKHIKDLKPIMLEGLPEKEICSIFSRCAFGDANIEKNLELAKIGQEIASKLNRSPLAAEVIGELLPDNPNEKHLKNVLDGICKLEHDKHNIMPALRLSYMHLPLHLKQCFSYLSVTPKECELLYSKVIGIWMALGMVNQNTEKEKEDVVQDYNKLISMSYFHSTKEDVYILHDVLHDLAESIYGDYSFRLEDNDHKKIPKIVRHLSVTTESLVGLKEKALVLKNLRSLLFFHHYEVDFGADLRDIFKQLKSIRVLSLSYCCIKELPNDLSHLIHLRYLDLSHTGIRKLPDEVTKLYHLRILNLSQLELAEVPAKMNELINLRSLICSEKILSMVQGIGKLTQLQKLMWPFSVQKVKGFDIGQLRDLNELRGCLHIKDLQYVNSGKQAGEANLCKKENLIELVLSWKFDDSNTNLEVDNKILEDLKPNGKLKKLCIDGYKGNRSPNWMLYNRKEHSVHLDNLESLKLINCKALEDLPSLGDLPKLEVLELKGLHTIKRVEPGFCGSARVSGFPCLRELIFDNLPELEVWTADVRVNSFPRLEVLQIEECPKLTKIPSLPSTLQKLEISNVGLGEFPKLLTRTPSALPSSSSLSSSLAILSIKGCPQLRYPSKWLLESEDCLKNLQELTIVPCDKRDAESVQKSNKFTHVKILKLD